MKQKVLVVFLFVLCLLSKQNFLVHAAQSNPITLESISLAEAKGSTECLKIDLLVTNLAKKHLVIKAIPFTKEGNKPKAIQNASGDPKDTGKDGTIVSSITLQIDTDTDYWDADHGGGVQVCIDTEHFPITKQGITYYIALDFFEVDGTSGTFIGEYDTTTVIGALTVPGYTKKIRITNVKTKGADLFLELGKNPEVGQTYTFTLEVVGYKGKQLQVAIYGVDSDGKYISSSAEQSDYQNSDGFVMSAQTISPSSDDVLWLNGQTDTTAMKLFIPYSVLPAGAYTMHPLFVVSELSEAGKEEKLYTLDLGISSLSVQMKPS